jgi:hypothetical protein
VIALFLERGADINEAPDNADLTLSLQNGSIKNAFCEAAWRGQPAVVEMLLGLGADAALRDTKGRTPLELAELQVHQSCVHILNMRTLPRVTLRRTSVCLASFPAPSLHHLLVVNQYVFCSILRIFFLVIYFPYIVHALEEEFSHWYPSRGKTGFNKDCEHGHIGSLLDRGAIRMKSPGLDRHVSNTLQRSQPIVLGEPILQNLEFNTLRVCYPEVANERPCNLYR